MARAVQYLRMSTERQAYSMPYQSAANAAYATQHGREIVRTFADAGTSGLTLARRSGLQELLAEIIGGAPDFEVVLVYDVSRWGRFQDPDEGAHYEFPCRQRASSTRARPSPTTGAWRRNCSSS